MTQHAKVDSIAALQAFRAGLVKFGEAASLALDEMSSEVQRTLLWLRDDRYKYWAKQLQVRTDEHTQARLALKRRKIFDRALSGSVSSCIDERKALQKAERRLQEAQYRFRRVRMAIQQIEKAQSDYKGLVKGLVGDLEVNLPNARARLDRMVVALEKYVALLPPEARATALSQPDAPGMEWESFTREPGHVSDRPSDFQDLRAQLPLPPSRNELDLINRPPDWLREYECHEDLMAAVGMGSLPHLPVEPEDRLVLGWSDTTPTAWYLVRNLPSRFDSGWCLVPGMDQPPSTWNRIMVADLVQVCPSIKSLLSLPAGYLVVLDTQRDERAILGPEDELVWRSQTGGDERKEGEK